MSRQRWPAPTTSGATPTLDALASAPNASESIIDRLLKLKHERWGTTLPLGVPSDIEVPPPTCDLHHPRPKYGWQTHVWVYDESVLAEETGECLTPHEPATPITPTSPAIDGAAEIQYGFPVCEPKPLPWDARPAWIDVETWDLAAFTPPWLLDADLAAYENEGSVWAQSETTDMPYDDAILYFNTLKRELEKRTVVLYEDPPLCTFGSLTDGFESWDDCMPTLGGNEHNVYNPFVEDARAHADRMLRLSLDMATASSSSATTPHGYDCVSSSSLGGEPVPRSDYSMRPASRDVREHVDYGVIGRPKPQQSGHIDCRLPGVEEPMWHRDDNSHLCEIEGVDRVLSSVRDNQGAFEFHLVV
ncbi:hypothetical protein OE88DRAFT_1660334 [Heliocybe sulcata]|uniref:Uncharacterized protein n=1 Tax=Heliocybe sulcata TaxID=5364 RepID=A0A5C3N0E1_9AGAM|nr:hypothetical protein OE88DRAFT_1660334 [Heliocybe sulcata]